MAAWASGAWWRSTIGHGRARRRRRIWGTTRWRWTRLEGVGWVERSDGPTRRARTGVGSTLRLTQPTRFRERTRSRGFQRDGLAAAAQRRQDGGAEQQQCQHQAG